MKICLSSLNKFPRVLWELSLTSPHPLPSSLPLSGLCFNFDHEDRQSQCLKFRNFLFSTILKMSFMVRLVLWRDSLSSCLPMIMDKRDDLFIFHPPLPSLSFLSNPHHSKVLFGTFESSVLWVVGFKNRLDQIDSSFPEAFYFEEIRSVETSFNMLRHFVLPLVQKVEVGSFGSGPLNGSEVTPSRSSLRRKVLGLKLK